MVKESLLPSIGFRTMPAIKRFKDEWDSLFDGILEEFFGDTSSPTTSGFLQVRGTFPKLNVSESDDAYSVEIAVAGFSKDSINIEIEDNVMTVSSSKDKQSENTNNNCIYREIAKRSFRRVVRFPKKIIPDSAEASYKDGIITLSVKKVKESNKKEAVTVKVK